MEFLPIELLEKIFSHLSWPELNECSIVCSRWWDILNLHNRKVVVFDNCYLRKNQEPISVFEHSFGKYTSLRIEKTEGLEFGSLGNSVVELDLTASHLDFNELLGHHFKSVKILSVIYPEQLSYSAKHGVETLHLFQLKGSSENFNMFMSQFPELKSLYIESIENISETFLQYLEPWKSKIKGIPEDSVKMNDSTFLSIRDVTSFRSSRILTDWRINRDEIQNLPLKLERPLWLVQNDSEWETYNSYLSTFAVTNLELRKPLNIALKINKLKLHLSDLNLASYPNLLLCNNLEVSTYVYNQNNQATVSCFFGHQTISSSMRTLTIHFGSRKQCQKCWSFMLKSLSNLNEMHLHGTFDSLIVSSLSVLRNLSKLKVTIEPNHERQVEKDVLEWPKFDKLNSLVVRFRDAFTIQNLVDMIKIQTSLVFLEIHCVELVKSKKLEDTSSHDLISALIGLKYLKKLVISKTFVKIVGEHVLQELFSRNRFRKIDTRENVTVLY